MTVLISGGTAGAAEVLAAGIGGNKRGELIGAHTFGNASEQKLIPLDDGAALVLTVANYYTSADKSIPEEGVAPTVEVRIAREEQADIGEEEPPQLPSAEQPTPRPLAPEDQVLRKAIELLKGEARKQWGKLTDDDWEKIAGEKDKLLGKLQERYGWSRQEAERSADEYFSSRS